MRLPRRGARERSHPPAHAYPQTRTPTETNTHARARTRSHAQVSSNQGCRGVEFDHTADRVFVADEDGDVVHEMTTGGATVHDISVPT